MVALSRFVTAALAFAVASSVIACGALIGIEDGVPDPALGGADAATTTTDASSTDASPSKDASSTDASTADASARTPMGKPGGSTSSLPCGTATCSIPAQACCAYRTTGQTVFTASCATTCPAAGGTTDRVSTIKCSGPFNCAAGDRCCYATNGTSTTTSCKPSCGNQEVALCDPGASNQCGQFRSCRRFGNDTMPSSYGYCL